MRLLVLLPTRFLGNFVISLQAIAALIRTHDVDLVIDDRHAPLARLTLGDDFREIRYPRSAIRDQGPLRQLVTFAGVIRNIRTERYDTVVDLDGTSLSSNLVAFSRAGRRLGPGFVKRPRLYDDAIVMDQASQHCFDDFSKVAEALLDTPVPRKYLMLPTLPTPTLTSSLAALVSDQRRLICLHPSASKSYKEWSASMFATLSDTLHERGFHVVFLGAGDTERQKVEQIRAYARHPFTDTVDQLDIIQLAWLIQHSQHYIGNDSGPMHLAATTGTPVVALFGPTELIRWQPLTPTTTVVSHQDICHPDCQPEACQRNYQCMSAITLEEVLAIVDRDD